MIVLAATYTPIASTTLGSNTASIDFNSISGSYTDLVLVMNASSATSGENISIRFNSDTGNNYSDTAIENAAGSAGSARDTSKSRIRLQIGYGVNNSLTDNFIVSINNYSNSTTYKTALARSNSPAGTYAGVGAVVGLWRNTNAITSITVYCASGGNLLSGSTFTLYGIAAA